MSREEVIERAIDLLAVEFSSSVYLVSGSRVTPSVLARYRLRVSHVVGALLAELDERGKRERERAEREPFDGDDRETNPGFTKRSEPRR